MCPLSCVKLEYSLVWKLIGKCISLKALANTVYCHLRARMGLMVFKNVPLRTRRALSLYEIDGDSALLALNKTSLNSINTLLAIGRRYILYTKAMTELKHDSC